MTSFWSRWLTETVVVHHESQSSSERPWILRHVRPSKWVLTPRMICSSNNGPWRLGGNIELLQRVLASKRRATTRQLNVRPCTVFPIEINGLGDLGNAAAENSAYYLWWSRNFERLEHVPFPSPYQKFTEILFLLLVPAFERQIQLLQFGHLRDAIHKLWSKFLVQS